MGGRDGNRRGDGNRRSDGIFAGPIDLDGPRRQSPSFPALEGRSGLVVRHRASGLEGTIVRFEHGGVAIRTQRNGAVRLFRIDPGGFLVDGRPVTLVAPQAPASPRTPGRTASGSVAVRGQRAQVARASRILVEGVHDAELVEKVWGDDLRVEGVVVERLDGMDDLAAVVHEFRPGPQRRLGILLDHLVDGSKEARAAATVRHPQVLVRGTPYVDVWQAIRPRAAGIAAWPVVPPGTPWKEGILDALGVDLTTGAYWRTLLAKVSTFADLEAPLIGAVEELIDFVTQPQP